jgi:hypothetical protein
VIFLETHMPAQITLSAEQIESFYHEEFVAYQVRDFRALVAVGTRQGVVVDIGGAAGISFAHWSTSSDWQRV